MEYCAQQIIIKCILCLVFMLSVSIVKRQAVSNCILTVHQTVMHQLGNKLFVIFKNNRFAQVHKHKIQHLKKIIVEGFAPFFCGFVGFSRSIIIDFPIYYLCKNFLLSFSVQCIFSVENLSSILISDSNKNIAFVIE